MKSARTIRTLKRCGINPSLVGFAGASAPSGKSIRRMERKDHHKHLSATGDEYMTMYSLPRTPECQRGFRAVQAKWEDDHA
jgi:hypothetical protein